MKGNEESLSLVRIWSAVLALVWYIAAVAIAWLGFREILLNFKSGPKKGSKKLCEEGISIIRPIKGIELNLENCLESSFQQNYPKDKLEIIFCFESIDDDAIRIAQKLISKYPDIDAKLLVESKYFGPNPKVNNLAKGFVQAKYDIVWVMDSNVWAAPFVLENSVKYFKPKPNAYGSTRGQPEVGIILHVPLALSVDTVSDYSISSAMGSTGVMKPWDKLGARLDEMFLLTAHLKFYVAINKVAIALRQWKIKYLQEI